MEFGRVKIRGSPPSTPHYTPTRFITEVGKNECNNSNEITESSDDVKELCSTFPKARIVAASVVEKEIEAQKPISHSAVNQVTPPSPDQSDSKELPSSLFVGVVFDDDDDLIFGSKNQNDFGMFHEFKIYEPYLDMCSGTTNTYPTNNPFPSNSLRTTVSIPPYSYNPSYSQPQDIQFQAASYGYTSTNEGQQFSSVQYAPSNFQVPTTSSDISVVVSKPINVSNDAIYNYKSPLSRSFDSAIESPSLNIIRSLSASTPSSPVNARRAPNPQKPKKQYISKKHNEASKHEQPLNKSGQTEQTKTKGKKFDELVWFQNKKTKPSAKD